MHYYLGIDGGGSRSELKALDDRLQPLFQLDGPSLQAARTPLAELTARIMNLVDEALDRMDEEPPTGVAIALAGAGRPETRRELHAQLEPLVTPAKLLITTDVKATHVGAFDDGDGVLVIAGTGSICLARHNNKWKRAGGYGPVIGDEGSGYRIGARGLRAVGDFFDGGPETGLSHRLKEKWNINGREAVIRWIHDPAHSPAQVAPLVLALAREGDTVCRSLAGRQAELLAGQAARLYEAGMPIALHGGLFGNAYYSELLQQEIHRILPKSQFQTARYDAATGACLMLTSRID